MLILNGDADPQDPPENVANAKRELPNSLSLVMPNAAHTVGHLGCMSSIVVDFFKRGSVDGLVTDCVQGYQLAPFELGD